MTAFAYLGWVRLEVRKLVDRYRQPRPASLRSAVIRTLMETVPSRGPQVPRATRLTVTFVNPGRGSCGTPFEPLVGSDPVVLAVNVEAIGRKL